MQFAYEAIALDGRLVADRIEADSQSQAADALRTRGLTITRLDAAGENDAAGRRWLEWGGINSRDMMVFTRQIKMLIDSGAAVVQALEAIERQTVKRSVARMVGQIRAHVEKGGSLSDALARHPTVFPSVYRAMITAGEATASLPASLSRLADLAERQQRVRKTVTGALLYPAILSVMCGGAVTTLVTFVVPRFRDLFVNLRAPLPASTEVMFALSGIVTSYWPMLLLAIGVSCGAVTFAARRPGTRQWLDERIMSLPVLGRIRNRLMVARVLRMWAAMLRSHVPLLETIQLSRNALTSSAMLDLMDKVEDAVAGGGRVGRTLAQTRIVEPVVASAISTGEENGKLAEAVEFVSNWMDDDNTQLIAATTRVVEPALLAFMGLIVGTVAMSLFIPLFDLATAGAR
jgi:type II secretory pathway component PulF